MLAGRGGAGCGARLARPGNCVIAPPEAPRAASAQRPLRQFRVRQSPPSAAKAAAVSGTAERSAEANLSRLSQGSVRLAGGWPGRGNHQATPVRRGLSADRGRRAVDRHRHPVAGAGVGVEPSAVGGPVDQGVSGGPGLVDHEAHGEPDRSAGGYGGGGTGTQHRAARPRRRDDFAAAQDDLGAPVETAGRPLDPGGVEDQRHGDLAGLRFAYQVHVVCPGQRRAQRPVAGVHLRVVDPVEPDDLDLGFAYAVQPVGVDGVAPRPGPVRVGGRGRRGVEAFAQVLGQHVGERLRQPLLRLRQGGRRGRAGGAGGACAASGGEHCSGGQERGEFLVHRVILPRG